MGANIIRYDCTDIIVDIVLYQERTRAQLDELKSFAERETKRYDTVVKCMRYSHFKAVFSLKASKQSNWLETCNKKKGDTGSYPCPLSSCCRFLLAP